MAILQLSRITNRKGLSENLPQLAGGEFGWALDDRQLFIGNGEIIEGAPVVGNTEVLTEFSDILALAATYTYTGEAAGYVVDTGIAGNAIVRTLQSKFDDVVSIRDFGAIGDGIVDDTDAINRALFELFCRATNESIRRSLFFPAGVYNVTGKIKIPPYAKLYGEGLSSSIINFIKSATVAATTITVGNRYVIETIGSTNFTSIGATNNTAGLIFVATTSGTGTGTVRLIATDSVVETSDSLHQVTPNIGNGAAIPPTGIEIESIGIYSDEEITLLKLVETADSGFCYVGLKGPNTTPATQINNTASVQIISTLGPTRNITFSKLATEGTTYGLHAMGDVKGVVLETSRLDQHTKGVFVTNESVAASAIVLGTRYKIREIGVPIATDFTAIGASYNRVGETFTAGHFPAKSLTNGVEYVITVPGTTDFTLIGAADSVAGTVFTASGPAGGTGITAVTSFTAPAGNGTVISLDALSPSGVSITRNIFDNIAEEGIHFENVVRNSSGYNVFADVGNGNGGNATPATPVIRMTSDQCISVGDLFEREDESVQPRVLLEGNGGIFFNGAESIKLGSFEREVGIEAIIPAATPNETIFEFTNSEASSYRVDYSIRRLQSTQPDTRMGRMYISNPATNPGANELLGVVSFSDEFTESADTGIVLDVVSVREEPDPIGSPGTYTYTKSAMRFTSDAGADATLNFSVVRLD